MDAKRRLKRASSNVADAVTALKRARNELGYGTNVDLERALRELDDAESEIRRAIREIPDD